ncbi:hypothetical protein F511_19271 [Dorcoceras hygrometricum]|uniref:Uncharacterized protein n=1 Tax=Dorcoceras hygrometricum TaxID=472368 RepID=A0A2Z7CZW9_9LAMI|nr:hypothetical protein F511_19271 [Dorcoceras hygrometricum]
MTFRVVRTNQYNQDLGLIHSTNGNHLESPKEGSWIDHQVTIYLHAQNITIFPTNETWDTASRRPTTIVAPESLFRTCPTDHDNIGYPRMSASGESSTTMHRLLHASGSHPIPPPNDPNLCWPCGLCYYGPWGVGPLGGPEKVSSPTATENVPCRAAVTTSSAESHLSYGFWICVARDFFVVILAQKIEAPGSNQIHKEFWLFTVGGGRSSLIRSATGTRLLRQPALEGLTNLARTESPRRGDRNKSNHDGGGTAATQGAAADGSCGRGRGGAQELEARVLVDTASRGPTTIVAPKSQFHTCPIDHGKEPSNIAPLSPRSTTIGISRVARDPITTHTSWRSNSDITSVTRVSMTFRVVRTNQYNQDLGLIHSTNGNHLESPNKDSSINHQMLVSSSGGLIHILAAQSTRNEFRIHSDY